MGIESTQAWQEKLIHISPPCSSCVLTWKPSVASTDSKELLPKASHARVRVREALDMHNLSRPNEAECMRSAEGVRKTGSDPGENILPIGHTHTKFTAHAGTEVMSQNLTKHSVSAVSPHAKRPPAPGSNQADPAHEAVQSG